MNTIELALESYTICLVNLETAKRLQSENGYYSPDLHISDDEIKRLSDEVDKAKASLLNTIKARVR